MHRHTRLALTALLIGGFAACTPAPVVTVQGPVVDVPPAMAPAVTPDRTTIVTVNFEFDSHTISPAYYGPLDSLAAALVSQQLSGYRFDIDGHTDIVGRLGYNIALSILRAQAVANYLARRGVPRDSMRVQGFGPLRLFDPANPRGAVNRRVEITSVR